MDTKIPADILALIDDAEKSRKRAEEEIQNARSIEDENKKNELNTLFQQAVEAEVIPDCIRPFFSPKEVEYELSWYETAFEFLIPGLAPFVLVISRLKDKPCISKWIVSGIGEGDWDEDLDVCRTAVYSFSHRYVSVVCDASLEEVLRQAHEVASMLPKAQEILNERYTFTRSKRVEQNQRAADAIKEERALFDALKNDPIAISLMKAFLLLREERTHFEEQLSDTYETMDSMEENWSRRASQLRREADAIERRAKEEKEQLQSDIYEIESRLKKAERGW